MSAYMVDRHHIVYLVKAYQEYIGELTDPVEMGQMLWNENLASIHARYPDTIDNPDNIPGTAGESYKLTRADFARTWPELDPAQVLQACKCLVYQSCEHAGWKQSKAAEILHRIQSAAINRLIAHTEWGAPKPDVQVRTPKGKLVDCVSMSQKRRMMASGCEVV